MTIHELLQEYNLSADDLRWSLCMRLAESLIQSFADGGPENLARRLWSGEIGDELYDLEERWTRRQADRLERKVLDEGHLRDELSGMTLDRISRRQN